MSNLLVFWILRPGFLTSSVAGAGVAFYIWVGMFGVFVVSQFWAFAADLYTDERGERLLPLIAIGATAGAVAGSFLTDALRAVAACIDSSALLLVATLPLAASIAAHHASPTSAVRSGDGPRPRGRPPAAAGRRRQRRRARRSSCAIATCWPSPASRCSPTGSAPTARTCSSGSCRTRSPASWRRAASPTPMAMKTFVREGTTAFYGNFFFWVNVCALVLQALLASRLLKYGGFGLILLLLPVISLVTYSAMAFLPILLVVRVMKTAENSTAYSINNTARQVLWLPTTAEMKYKAKPAIETFFVRVGDGLAAATVARRRAPARALDPLVLPVQRRAGARLAADRRRRGARAPAPGTRPRQRSAAADVLIRERSGPRSEGPGTGRAAEMSAQRDGTR